MRSALLITTNFFPYPSVASVRVTNFARMLPGLGWEATCVSRDMGHRAGSELLEERLGPNVHAVYLDRSGEPVPVAPGDAPPESKPASKPASGSPRKQRTLKRMIANTALDKWAVPDTHKWFWGRACAAIERLVDETGAEVVLTSSPMHSVHLVGLHLKRVRPSIAWVVDERDPHLLDPRFSPRGAACGAWPLARAYERRVYRGADVLMHAIPVHARWARREYPFARDKIHELPHAAPASLATAVTPDRAGGGRLSVRVVGSIGDADALALARAVKALADGGMDVELRLVGATPATRPKMEAALGDRLVVTGRLRHDLAQEQIAGADALVSFVSPERSGFVIVSSKLYEFVSARKPILHINPSGPDRHLIHALPPSVRCLRRPSADELVGGLRWALSGEARALAADPDAARRFDDRFGWDAHARTLGALLDEAVGRARR